MPAVRSKTAAENSGKIICRECQSKDMRQRKRTFFGWIFSFRPYTCGRCGYPCRRFSLSAGSFITLIVLGSLAYGGVWLKRNPPEFLTPGAISANSNSQLDQAEALARARTTAGGQLSTFENMMLRKPKIALNNATIVRLVKAEVSKDVIIQMIRTSDADYDLSASAVIDLKEAGVDQAIILALIDASYAAH